MATLLELRRRVRSRERHREAARPPYAPLDRDVVPTRRHEVANAFGVQVVAPREQPSGHPPGRIKQLAEIEGPFGGYDRRPLSNPGGTLK